MKKLTFKKKLKNRKKLVTSLRGGFAPTAGSLRRATMKGLEQYAKDALKDAASKAGSMTLAEMAKVAKGWKLPTAVSIGADIVAGVVASTATTNGTSAEAKQVPYVSSESVGSRNIGGSGGSLKKYKTVFHAGQPTSKSMHMLAKLNGKTKLTLVSTMTDALYARNTVARNYLRQTAGFNQKLLYILPETYQVIAQDIKNIYDLTNLAYQQDKITSIYGQTMNLFQDVRIINRGSYFPTKVSLKLYTARIITNGISNAASDAFPTAGELAAGFSLVGRLPLQYVLGPGVNLNGPLSGHTCLVDKRVSLLDSPAFNQVYAHAKTFTKWLKPGEVWDFKSITHCGPGLRLDILKRTEISNARSIMCYLTILEAHGSPCEAINDGDRSESFIGDSPVYLNLEMSKGHESVVRSLSDSNFEPLAIDGGMNSREYAIKAFTKRESDGVPKIVNYDAANVLPQPSVAGLNINDIFIPVLTDNVVNFAGSALLNTKE